MDRPSVPVSDDEEPQDIDSDSGSDKDWLPETVTDTESEESAPEDVTDNEGTGGVVQGGCSGGGRGYAAKQKQLKLTWASEPPRPQRADASDVVRCLFAKPCGRAAEVDEPKEAFELMFNDDMLRIIVIHTNAKIDEYLAERMGAGEELASGKIR